MVKSGPRVADRSRKTVVLMALRAVKTRQSHDDACPTAQESGL